MSQNLKTKMKKVLPFTLLIALTAFVFNSCGNKNEQSTAQETAKAKYDQSTPEATIKTLIDVSSKKDKQGLSLCFSKQSAGEFKSIVNQTLSDDDLTELKEMFENAKILSTRIDGTRAVVSIHLTKRDEEISMAKENENWVILDF